MNISAVLDQKLNQRHVTMEGSEVESRKPIVTSTVHIDPLAQRVLALLLQLFLR